MKKTDKVAEAPAIVHPKKGGVYIRHDDKTVELESDYLARIAGTGEAAESSDTEETAETLAPRKRGRKARR